MTDPTPPNLTNLRLGTAPDSWGVWFPDDPHQVPWHQFLDEAAAAGYHAVELGPFGYLPTDPARLRDELGRRNLTLTGGTAGTHLHRGSDSLEEALTGCRQVATRLAAMDAPYLITHHRTMDRSRCGPLRARTHPSRRVRRTTDVPPPRQHPRRQRGQHQSLPRGHRPPTVSLCLDTGHVAYAGGDNQAVVAKHPDRIGYVHLKSIDPEVVTRVQTLGMSFADAVKTGAMVEPNHGEPHMPPLLADLDALNVPLWAIVEHDIYPAPAHAPLPIAARTCGYYLSCGLG